MTTSSHLVRLRLFAVLLSSVAAFALLGCDSPGGTILEIRKSLDAFKTSPSQSALEHIEKSFVKIDTSIKDFEAKEDFAQADLFRRQAMTLRYEYRAMREAFLKWSEEQSPKKSSSGSVE
jgi:hypothetical protein